MMTHKTLEQQILEETELNIKLTIYCINVDDNVKKMIIADLLYKQMYNMLADWEEYFIKDEP